jgi:hypothetical protein
LNARDGSAHAGIIRDLEVFIEWNVKVNPDKGFLPSKIKLIEFAHEVANLKKETRQDFLPGCMMELNYLEINCAK